MVAGIFEKSKRLRKVVFFDIQMTPNLSVQPGAAKRALRGDRISSRPGRSSAYSTRLCTVTVLTCCRHVCALGDIAPHGRRMQRIASMKFCLSVPVLRPVSVPLLTEQFANCVRLSSASQGRWSEEPPYREVGSGVI